MGLYHPLDGDTNLKDKLLCFLTPNKKKFKENPLADKPVRKNDVTIAPIIFTNF